MERTVFERFIGQEIIVYYDAGNGRTHTYIGILEETDNTHILLKDREKGDLLLLKTAIKQMNIYS